MRQSCYQSCANSALAAALTRASPKTLSAKPIPRASCALHRDGPAIRAAARDWSSRVIPTPSPASFGRARSPRGSGLGQFGLVYFEPEISATSQRIRPEDKFLGTRLERLLDGVEGVIDLTVEGQGLG